MGKEGTNAENILLKFGFARILTEALLRRKEITGTNNARQCWQKAALLDIPLLTIGALRAV